MMIVVRPFTCPLCLHQASLTTPPTPPPAAAAATPVTPTRTPPPAVATAPPVTTTTKASFLFEPSNKCNAVNQHTVFGAVSHQIRRVVHSKISVIICYYFCRAVNYIFHSAICLLPNLPRPSVTRSGSTPSSRKPSSVPSSAPSAIFE